MGQSAPFETPLIQDAAFDEICQMELSNLVDSGCLKVKNMKNSKKIKIERFLRFVVWEICKIAWGIRF